MNAVGDELMLLAEDGLSQAKMVKQSQLHDEVLKQTPVDDCNAATQSVNRGTHRREM